jgi:glutamate-1-semialdehyde 2,1-aminomutase
MPTELETQIAALAVSMVPNIDKLGFWDGSLYECSKISLRISKKDKIIKFAGCYHGHSDSLIQAEVARLLFFSNSPGVTAGQPKDTLLASYNDLENVRTLIEANKK